MGATLILVMLAVLVLVTLAARPLRDAWTRMRAVDAVVEDHSVMCFQNAQPAEVSFVADRRRGRWVDVAWCSHQPDGVRCDKSCLAVMNDAGVRPGVEARASR